MTMTRDADFVLVRASNWWLISLGWDGVGKGVPLGSWCCRELARKLVGMLTLDTFASETIVASDAAQ